MCLEIFRDAGKAFSNAAKRKSMQKTALVLVESAVMAAAAITIITSKLTLAPWIFALVIGVGIVAGFVIKTIANALGSKGGFFEGLTAISYALAPITLAILLIAVLAWLPVLGIILGLLASLILFAFGLAVLYRGVKEMFRTDMITAFVVVSVFAMAFIIAMQFSLSLNLLLSAGSLLPGV